MRKDIQEIIERYKIPTFGNKKSIKNTENYLRDNEKVLFLSPSNANIITSGEDTKPNPTKLTNKRPGIFIITTKRVLHVSKVLFDETIENIPISEVSSYEIARNGLTASVMKIYSNHNILEVDLSYKKEIVAGARSAMDKAIEYRDKALGEMQSPKSDIPAEIKQLAELKDQGILTEEEFEEKKKELLSRM